MPLCKDCKFLKDDLWCVSPSNGESLVTGEPNVVFASINRSANSIPLLKQVKMNCGISAMFFVPKAPTKKPSVWELLKYHLGFTMKVN